MGGLLATLRVRGVHPSCTGEAAALARAFGTPGRAVIGFLFWQEKSGSAGSEVQAYRKPPSLPFFARAWVLCASSPLVAHLVPCGRPLG